MDQLNQISLWSKISWQLHRPPVRSCDQATPHVPAALWPLAALSAAWRQIREKRGRDVACSHAEWVYIKWKSCSLNMKLTIHQFDQCLIMQNLRHQEISWKHHLGHIKTKSYLNLWIKDSVEPVTARAWLAMLLPRAIRLDDPLPPTCSSRNNTPTM